MSDFDNAAIRKVDGGLLLIFKELLARRQAGAVARHLGLSASSISHALARLREVYGDPLFLRRPHGLEPTARALELAPKILALVQLLGESIEGERSFDPATSRRRFKLACAEPIDSVLGPALVETFRSEAPHATFSTRWAVLGRALQAVTRRDVEVAIGVFRHVPAEMRATPLYEDDYCVVARSGHPAVRSGAVDAEAYATVGHVFVGNPDVALAEEPAQRAVVEQTYGRLPGPDAVRTHAYVTHWESAMLIVAQSDALADCPRSLAQRHARRLGLQIVEPPYPPFRFSIQAVHLLGPPDAGRDWLMTQLRAAALA